MSEDEFDGYIDQEEDDKDEDESDEEEEMIGDIGDIDGAEGDGTAQFSGQGGCTQDMTNKSPIDFFQLFLTDNILQMVVEQTNLFAEQFIQSHELARHSRVQQWGRSSHDINEIKRFLALVIIMGLVSYPSIEDSWVTSWPFATATFSSVMSRDRFSLILRFLHLSDSTKYIPKGQPGHNPLFKL